MGSQVSECGVQVGARSLAGAVRMGGFRQSKVFNGLILDEGTERSKDSWETGRQHGKEQPVRRKKLGACGFPGFCSGEMG